MKNITGWFILFSVIFPLGFLLGYKGRDLVLGVNQARIDSDRAPNMPIDKTADQSGLQKNIEPIAKSFSSGENSTSCNASASYLAKNLLSISYLEFIELCTKDEISLMELAKEQFQRPQSGGGWKKNSAEIYDRHGEKIRNNPYYFSQIKIPVRNNLIDASILFIQGTRPTGGDDTLLLPASINSGANEISSYMYAWRNDAASTRLVLGFESLGWNKHFNQKIFVGGSGSAYVTGDVGFITIAIENPTTTEGPSEFWLFMKDSKKWEKGPDISWQSISRDKFVELKKRHVADVN